MSNQTLINLSKLIPKEILEADKKKVETEKKKLENSKNKSKKKSKDYYSNKLNNFTSLEELDKEIEKSREEFLKVFPKPKNSDENLHYKKEKVKYKCVSQSEENKLKKIDTINQIIEDKKFAKLIGKKRYFEYAMKYKK